LEERTPTRKGFRLRKGSWMYARTLREELGLSYPQITFLLEDYGPPPAEKELTAEEIVRRVRFGLIDVPDDEESMAVLRRRNRERAAEMRRRA
jgi:hypothetical protein